MIDKITLVVKGTEEVEVVHAVHARGFKIIGRAREGMGRGDFIIDAEDDFGSSSRSTTRRLQEWFNDAPKDPPYKDGTLLYFSIDRRDVKA